MNESSLARQQQQTQLFIDRLLRRYDHLLSKASSQQTSTPSITLNEMKPDQLQLILDRLTAMVMKQHQHIDQLEHQLQVIGWKQDATSTPSHVMAPVKTVPMKQDVPTKRAPKKTRAQ